MVSLISARRDGWLSQRLNEILYALFLDPLYVRAGPAVPQWVVPGLASLYGTGVFLLPSSQFTFEARILALEIYGHTAGEIKVFVSLFILIIIKYYIIRLRFTIYHQIAKNDNNK